MPKIVFPLPDKDFDLTEVAIPWKYCKNSGIDVVFATEKGKVPEVDPLLISGVIFGQLSAKPDAIGFYKELILTEEFQKPITYSSINVSDYDALHLAGGHAKGMKQYLESELLQDKVVQFFKANKVVGAICHGGIVLSRSIDPANEKSIIYNRKVTALTKFLERIAYYITAWKHGDYYRTYPEYVQDEISRNLENKSNFKSGFPFKEMVVEDANLITARWPLDAKLYAQTLVKKIKNQ